MDFDKLKSNWKKANLELAKNKNISMDEIEILISQKSKDASVYFKKSIKFSLIYQLIGVALFIIPIMNYVNFPVFESVLILMACSVGLFAFFNFKQLNKIKNIDSNSDNLKKLLISKISFYKNNLIPGFHVTGISNAFILFAALLYLKNFRFGLEFHQVYDTIVYSIVMVLIYLYTVRISIFKNKYYINELTISYSNLEDKEYSDTQELKIQHKKMLKTLFIVLVILFIITLLAVLLMKFVINK